MLITTIKELSLEKMESKRTMKLFLRLHQLLLPLLKKLILSWGFHFAMEVLELLTRPFFTGKVQLVSSHI